MSGWPGSLAGPSARSGSRLGYGLLLRLIMHGLVPLARWEALSVFTNLAQIAEQWFCHLILVGLPIALVARRHLARPVYLPRR